MKNVSRLAVLVVSAVLAGSACSGSRPRKSPSDASKGGAAGQGADAAYVPGVDVTEASLRGSEFASVEGLAPVYFDYDSSSLSAATLEALKKNAQYLKDNPKLEVLVAGHCDERGTVEYNLALGQKRAKEVREYYIRLGVNGKSVATISYGKESPLCSESTEDCWSKSRRAETRIRAGTAAAERPSPQRTQ